MSMFDRVQELEAEVARGLENTPPVVPSAHDGELDHRGRRVKRERGAVYVLCEPCARWLKQARTSGGGRWLTPVGCCFCDVGCC